MRAVTGEAELRSYIADWRGLLRGQPIQARQMVLKVLEARLVFMPEEDDAGRRYRFAGHAGIERLVLATPLAKKMVAPGGAAVPAEEFLAFTLAGVAVA